MSQRVERNLKMINMARDMAIKAHKGTKYGKLPYEYHLRAVVNELPRDSDPETIAAAWLHDAVEDTDLTLFEIREKLGGHVARIVDCVTDEPGNNRKERKAKTYEKLRKGPLEARTVKLADRIANTKASIENPGLADMYRKEFPEFIRNVGFDPENNDLTVQLFFLYLDSLEQAE